MLDGLRDLITILTSFGGDESLHRNWALHNIEFKNKYVFILDADERISSALAATLINLELLDQDKSAFRVKRSDYLGQACLKHVQATSWYIRLVIPQNCFYTRQINPVLEVLDNEIGELRGCINHYPFSKGWERWFDKHNQYSTMEAYEYLKAKQGFSIGKMVKSFYSRNFIVRRKYIKMLFYHMPFRPLLRFFYLYIFKLGFLDGKAGFTYATLQCIYEYMIVLKSSRLNSLDHQ